MYLNVKCTITVFFISIYILNYINKKYKKLICSYIIVEYKMKKHFYVKNNRSLFLSLQYDIMLKFLNANFKMFYFTLRVENPRCKEIENSV